VLKNGRVDQPGGTASRSPATANTPPDCKATLAAMEGFTSRQTTTASRLHVGGRAELRPTPRRGWATLQRLQSSRSSWPETALRRSPPQASRSPPRRGSEAGRGDRRRAAAAARGPRGLPFVGTGRGAPLELHGERMAAIVARGDATLGQRGVSLAEVHTGVGNQRSVRSPSHSVQTQLKLRGTSSARGRRHAVGQIVAVAHLPVLGSARRRRRRASPASVSRRRACAIVGGHPRRPVAAAAGHPASSRMRSCGTRTSLPWPRGRGGSRSSAARAAAHSTQLTAQLQSAAGAGDV